LPEYPYIAFVRAAAPIYGGTKNTVQHFRFRIDFLKHQNVLGTGKDVKVGTGRRIRYTFDHLDRWLCCLELMELGMPATTAIRLVIAQWRTELAPIFQIAHKTVPRQPGDGDIVLLLPNVHVVSANWTAGRDFRGIPDITYCTLGELPGRMAKAAKSPPAGRMLTTNLSSLMRRFHEGLAAWADEPRQKSAKSAGKTKQRSKPRARKRA